ncbi:MAG: TRAM domain-containing protein [Ilumatobacteraceae bacterium]
MPLLPPDSVVTIEKLVAGGDGLAHLPDGRVLFVRGSLPGETVEVELSAEKRDFARARVVRLIEPSTRRVRPPCPAMAAGCGGCGWQHVAPEHQLELKVEIVRDALRRTAKLPEAEVRAGNTVPPWAYRTTVRLAAAPSTRVGLRRAHDHRVVPLDLCLVAHPTLTEVFAAMRLDAPAEVSLRVGLASGERSALVHPGRSRRPPRLTGLPADVAIGPAATVHETVAGVSLQISAPSFFQVGPLAAELLIATVAKACAGYSGGTMLDAYGGVGLFAAALPGAGERPVIVVESSPSACADARINLRQRDATVVCTTFETWTPVPVDLVVADPARAGLGRDGADRLAATGADRIVLVSCDPVAMARDGALLADRGYRHAVTEVLDLFPNTPHIEAVTAFQRIPGTRRNPDG